MKWKQVMLIIGISSVTSVSSVWLYGKFANPQVATLAQSADGNTPSNYAGFFNAAPGAETTDFTKAAQAAVPAVVHIKTKIPAKKITNQLPRNRGGMFDDFFDQFFNFPQIQPEQRASGSGVLISDDGYIVTNNHVISDGGTGIAEEINVTLNDKKTYKAKVIGKDPSSDIAVLKIDGTGFPYLIYGNSDIVKLGQWVLAIGYPLTLETTVTAGIVSAKGRSIGVNGRQSQTPIESFIQTDAAVNQGNSGGALITTDGQLIGINSAIYAPTGTYAGYSFAIPINLAKKIVNDLIKFGDVKRPYLGIMSDGRHINATDGAYVGTIAPDGAAATAGLKKGDIIKKINEVPITSWSELQGTIASLNAGEKISILYKRDGKEYTTTATLKADQSNFENIVANSLGELLGAELENADKKVALRNEAEGGIRVKRILKGGPLSRTRMQEEFIIISVNGAQVKTIDELSRAIASTRSESLNLEGFYDGYEGLYRYPVMLAQGEE
ncbi:MAG: PDZ domain-containing protein [Bacteroidetes bacterium]|nr:PDZ domain-containing protein [Bacteroidota bacterium]